MRIIIIEDEPFTAEDLAADLLQLRPSWEVVAMLNSVQQAKEWFATHTAIDLIFSDIELGDGTCFDVFSAYPPTAPVVFCTAYDQFALEAFQTNGIGYVLKPFSLEALQGAVEKFERLRPATPDLGPLLALLQAPKKGPQRLLVHRKDKIIPVSIEEVAIFYLHHETTMLMLLDGSTYHVPQVLGDIESLAGDSFYRASRQHLVNRAAITSATPQLSRKLLLDLKVAFPEQVTVSKEKTPIFLEWLEKCL